MRLGAKVFVGMVCTRNVSWESFYIDWAPNYTAWRSRNSLWRIGYIGWRDWIFGGVLSGEGGSSRRGSGPWKGREGYRQEQRQGCLLWFPASVDFSDLGHPPWWSGALCQISATPTRGNNRMQEQR